ncbi:ABC transporter ATP-binding protein [Asticcacaulis excentricus]|uniref:ABC transporter related protein n=1 Tax=Asticcacaulis excentricus (strain ATCC 15261 / DSM 4724 / KCTC 12464 / NCIMB 9791 / VKM B-1370 / CB 48) TaxID=573065 RepID=E8RM19_ASTEC|nr:ATP-binding cassette domain-containing protein [Asticcacaulis excentricus]ADU12711.1 ABC transporter related protein [Asticcacaulis excentricus CB 48]
MLLVTEDICVRRGEALIGLPDLHLGTGETLALTGPSGAGKTSLLLCLAGLVAPVNGTVRLEDRHVWPGHDIDRARLRGRRIGFVFADYRLIDSLSVMDNLQMARASAHLPLDFARAHHLLERLDITALKDRRADRLSQGQAQRVALARAVMNAPALILADEPSAALDEVNAEALLSLMLDLVQDEGTALIVATHDARVKARLGSAVEVVTGARA